MILQEFPKYKVSGDGKVFSLDYNHTGAVREIKQSLKRGYRVVGITNKDGDRKFIGVHRLVSMAFIPNPECKPEVNHKDGNKENNNFENLEWVTTSENQKHAFLNGLQKPHSCNMNGNSQGSKLPQSKLNEDIVYEMRLYHTNKLKCDKQPWLKFGISRNAYWYAISKKSKNRTWKHVPYPN